MILSNDLFHEIRWQQVSFCRLTNYIADSRREVDKKQTVMLIKRI
jgi:hypothetical protein